MQHKNSILWKRWHDPIQPLVGGKVHPPYDPTHDDDDDDFDSEHLEAKESFGSVKQSPYFHGNRQGNWGPSIVSPIGIIPLHESNLPSELYNFWMGHTNFTITHPLKAKIKRVEGVEAINVFSRYRFRIAIGKHFRQDEVKKAINAVVDTSVKVTSVQANPLDLLKSKMTKTFKFWAICVMPDGKKQCVGGMTMANVKRDLAKYDGKTKEIITSWEEINAGQGKAKTSSSNHIERRVHTC